jgi:hypothetical protein
MAETLSVGRLVSVETKLGVAVASDTCKRLNTPFLTVLAKIEYGGTVTEHTFEMSIPQFQSFAKNIKEISSLMESL